MLLPLATRYTDYDTKGHVNNAVYLTYFEMARAHAWRELLGLPDEPSFILADATVRYLSAAMIGDQLEIEMRAGEIRTKAWVWEYTIRCATMAAPSRRGRRSRYGSTTRIGSRCRFRTR